MTNYYVFPSGLKLVTNVNANTKSVSLGVFIGVGSQYEKSSENGLSHFVEHMLFKGTTKRSSFQIADEMESLGVRINAFTSKNITAYYTVSLDQHLERCFDVLSDIYLNSTIEEKEFEKEKLVILEEIQTSIEDPEELCLDNICEAYYGNTGPGQTILGARATIESYEADDVLSYYKKEYLANQTVISVAGNISEEHVYDLVLKYFESSVEMHTDKIVKCNNEKPIFSEIIAQKPIEQAHIALAYPGISYFNEKATAYTVISNLLGGGMSSRLFQSVREELGLVYNIYCATSSYVETGNFGIYLATNDKTVEKALVTIKKEIDKVRKKGFTDLEFSKAIEQLKTSLVLRMENTHSIMLLAGRYMSMKNELFDFDKEFSKVQRLKLSEVNQAIKDIFVDTDIALSYVGKQENIRLKHFLF